MNLSQILTIDAFGNVIGVIGMACCLLAFFFVQKENPNMLKYNLLNMFASIFLFISLCIHMNIASMCLEIFWFCGSIYGLVKVWKKHKQDKR